MISKTDIYTQYRWEVGEYGEFPAHFSTNARRIIASQYFRDGEQSFVDVVYRVVHALEAAYVKFGYGHVEEADKFARRLADMILGQRFSFNSPVWYNLGVYPDPQCSACFIQPVEDSMESIMDLARSEAMLFRHGSGTGTNLSPLRGSHERLSKSDGTASGPVSFMRMYDGIAQVVKSGGRTRRAAKMQILDIDHPDILDFIECKVAEDRKAKALIDSGMDPQEAYASVDLQNMNISVMVTDEFMAAVEDNMDWYTVARVGGHREKIGTAREVWDKLVQAAWECGDPGIMFRDTINRAHMIPHVAPINASNPCSEFVFIDGSACNLGSLNVDKYLLPDSWSVAETLLAGDVHTAIVAMDIIVSISSYPTREIRENSWNYRPLGLGITNVGAALMKRNIPYSKGSRQVGQFMHYVNSYAASASEELAERLGCYANFDGERVIEVFDQQHIELTYKQRNAQLTLVAPTGTISFMMDCDSTGIEPVLAERQLKTLAGGGAVEITPECVELCTHPEAIETAIGENPVSWQGHLDMMAAVQESCSGAISKTVNMPADSTPEDIAEVYWKAWGMGIKCIAVYRDGCKSFQPVVRRDEAPPPDVPDRHRLSDTRGSVTHKFTVGGIEGYMVVGLFDDGTPGEVFVKIAKEGSTASGFMDSWATMLSLSLQYGIPWSKLKEKFTGSKFEPSGFTANPELPMVSSIVDYIMRWIDIKFYGAPVDEDVEVGEIPPPNIKLNGDTCPDCGSMVYQTGTCKSCPSCGWGGGCG